MESIQTTQTYSCAGKATAQNRFLNVSQDIKKLEQKPNEDTFVTYAYDPSQTKRRFQSAILTPNPEMAVVNREIEAETNSLLNGYFDGTISDEELKNQFQDLAKKFFQGCEETGYTFYLRDNNMDKIMMETFYSEFRRKTLDTAVFKNNEEGKQYITGEMNAQRDWKYYNSDFYFKSESALSAITQGILELAQARGHEDFEVPNYREQELWLYDNFNSALCNPLDLSEKNLINRDQIPPRDFVWFYQSGGDASSKNVIIPRLSEINGVRIEEPFKAFDPKDHTTATMWASYRDVDGVLYRISSEINYYSNESDLHNVASLMKFTNGDSTLKNQVNQFLNNLQIYSKGYFECMRKPSINKYA